MFLIDLFDSEQYIKSVTLWILSECNSNRKKQAIYCTHVFYLIKIKEI